MTDSSTPKDNRYEQQDDLAFIVSIVFDNDNLSDSDSDSDFDDFDDNAFIIENYYEKYQSLLNKCIKITTTYGSLNIEYHVLKEEKSNHLEKIQLLENEHKSLLQRNNALTL